MVAARVRISRRVGIRQDLHVPPHRTRAATTGSGPELITGIQISLGIVIPALTGGAYHLAEWFKTTAAVVVFPI